MIDLLPALRAFALRLIRNPNDADDLVQETIVKALANKDRFTPGTNLKSWTFTIMKNTFLTQSRALQRSPVGTEEDAALCPVQVSSSQEWTVHYKDVEKAIGALAPRYKEALLLVASGASYEETAQRARCEIGTVKSRVGRARSSLLDTLGARNYGEAFVI
nr:sigma-70 family RNA polymerase sigma factor [Rhizobium cauense]